MDTRGGIVLTGILASSLALSGCLTYNGSREVVPFFELQTRTAKLGGAAMASPADAESGTAKTTEVVFRPLGSFESIGKERARAMSDAGMEYDGMYWHYIDKWIF